MTGQSKEDSGGNRLWCDQWCGARNPGFRKFKRDYAAGATATFLHEDDYSLWQAMNDTDQGGLAHGADAMPAVNAAGYLNAMRRRKRRQAKAFERVYAHQADERIRDLLDALPDNDRRGTAAWALVLSDPFLFLSPFLFHVCPRSGRAPAPRISSRQQDSTTYHITLQRSSDLARGC